MAELSASVPVLYFGNDNIGAAANSVFLHPGFSSGIATGTAIGLRIRRAGTLANLSVRHNVAIGNGNSVVYTVFVNGVATALTVTLATAAIGNADDDVNRVAVVSGDIITVQATKALALGNGAQNTTATFQFTA